MKRTLTTIRCVPRFGYDHTQVRTVDLDVVSDHDEEELRRVLRTWFEVQGIADAVYDIDVDDDGFFAIINDEVFHKQWGEPVF